MLNQPPWHGMRPLSCLQSCTQVPAQFECLQLQRIAVHLDGARIFNAATALGVPVSRIASCVDSVQFCLSKVSFPVFSRRNSKQGAAKHVGHCHQQVLIAGTRYFEAHVVH